MAFEKYMLWALRGISTKRPSRKFNFEKINIFCKEDCVFRKREVRVTSDSSCVRGKQSVGCVATCYCNRGKNELKADVNSSLLELIGCIEAVMYYLEDNCDVEAVLICDNKGVCNMVKNGFSEDPTFDHFVKKLIDLKAKGRICGPFLKEDSATEDDCGGGDPGRTVGVSLAQDAATEHDCGGGDPARAVGASLAQSLRHVEHDNAKILNSKGELSDDNASSHEKLRKCYDNLYRGVSSLAEALDIQPPVMPEDGHTTRVTSGDDSASSASGKESSTVEPVWDDEDTRTVDFRAFVPAVPLSESESKGNELAKVNSFNLPNFVRNQLNKLLKWASTIAGGGFERKESDRKQA